MRYPVTVEIRGSNPLRGAKFCVRAGLVTVLMYVSERVSEPTPTHQVFSE